MSKRTIALIAAASILLSAAAADAVKRRIAALPLDVGVAEAFNDCVEGTSGELYLCCHEARQVCEDECKLPERAGTEADRVIRCEAACDDAAVWCRRGIGTL